MLWLQFFDFFFDHFIGNFSFKHFLMKYFIKDLFIVALNSAVVYCSIQK